MDEKKKALYDALSGDYDLGTYEEFSEKLNDEGKRKALYDAAGQEYNLGTYEEYSSKLGFEPSAEQSTVRDFPVFDDELNGTPQKARGFKAGARESWKGLKAGFQNLWGEAANMVTGSSQDAADAVYELDNMLAEGRDVVEETADAWSDAGREIRTGALEFLPGWMIKGWKERVLDKAEKQKVLSDIRDVLGEAGGDVDKARELLVQRAQDQTYGDKQIASARDKFAGIQETEGLGAWIGSNAVQMIPSASALIVGALTKSPGAAKAIGMIGMGGMTAATAGSSMYEARQAGADDLKTWKTGVVDGMIEYITEKLPFDRYTSRILGKVKGEVAEDLFSSLRNNNATRNELERLLKNANERLGGKLFSKKNLAEYVGDMLAEGASEFSAEALQTMTAMMYEEPENYPTLSEILKNGWEGAKAGFFMGAVLGGASKTMEHNQHRKRRMEKGSVDIAQVDFGNGEKDVVEVVDYDDKTNTATVLHNGSFERVSGDAISDGYRFSYDEFENARLRELEDEAIVNGNVSEGQVQGMEETLARDTEEIMKLDPSITEEALRSGEVTAEEGSPLAEAIRKYNEDTARLNELAEARKQEVEARKAATRQQLEQSVGQPFWMQEDAGDGRYTETVEEIVYSDGRTGYVVGYDDAGNLTLVFSDDTKGFSSREDITNKLNSGEIVSDTPMGLDAYIESKVAQEDAIAEQARMSEEHALSIEDMIATHPQGTVINLGTEEEKIEVTIIAPPTADGAIVQMPDGTTPLMRWEDIAHAERTEITPKTDAQINQSVVDQYKVAYKPAVEVQPEPDATVREQAVERETPAKPLPLKADGTVDQTALWNEDPARWAKWNDEQRNDGGANSLNYISGAVAKEQAAIAEMMNAYNAESDFDARDLMEAEIQKRQARLNELMSLQAGYMQAAQQTVQQTAAVAEEKPAPVPQTPQEVRDAENKRREPLRRRAQDLSKKLGVKVNIAESLADVKEQAAREQILMTEMTSDKKVPGWFNPATGEVTIYLPHAKDTKDLEATIIHEVVAHKGIRGLLGEEGFNVLCDSVWEMMTEEERQEYLAYPGVNGNKRAAADEYIAHYAETLDLESSKPVWDRIINLITRILNTMGINLEMTKDQLSDIIVASYQKLAQDALADSVEELAESVESTQPSISEEQLNAPNSGEASQITATDGEVIADTNGKGGVRFSIRTWLEGGRDYLVAWLAKDITLAEDEKADILARMDEFYKNALLYSDSYAPFGTWSEAGVRYDNNGNPLMSVIKANGDYAMNLDFSLVCKKRRPLNRLLRTLVNRNAFITYTLRERELAEINWILQEHGFEVACALCFVDSKRYRVTGVADVFASLYNRLVKSIAPKGVAIAHFNYSNNPNVEKVEDGLDTLPDEQLNWAGLDKALKGKKEGSVEYKVAQYLREHPEARRLVDATDFIEAEGFESVKENNPDLLKFYNMKKGTGGPKASFGDVQYLNDILKNERTFSPEKAYAVGGVRLQSFSDFVPHMYFDYMQLFAELAAKKLPVHAYTKEVLFAKIFGLTGAKINLSLVPAVVEGGVAPGLDTEGNYAWADPVRDAEGSVIQQGQTFPFDEAMAIQNAEGYSKNCGAIAVGISDAHIEKMLDDPNIQFIIPYHKSSLNAIVARMTNIDQYKDYTNVQNTRKSTGSKLDKGTKDFNFNEYLHNLGESGSPQQAAQAYLDWCRENGFVPKFSQFAYHPNYYKLLVDFNTIDTTTGEYAPQGSVSMIFPTEQSAFGNVETLIQQGLQEDAELEEKLETEINSIADQVLARLAEISKEPKLSEKQQAKKMAELADERMAKIQAKAEGPIDILEEARKVVESDLRFSIADTSVSNVEIKDNAESPLPTTKEDTLALIPEGGLVTKTSEGEEVKVSRRSARHSLARNNKDLYAVFARIDEVVSSAIKIGNLPVSADEVGKTNSVAVYYVPVFVNGTQYSARLIVKETIHNEKVLDTLSLYNVSLHKEKTPSNTNVGESEDSGVYSGGVKSEFKVRELIHNTQEEDKKLVGIEGEETRFRITAEQDKAYMDAVEAGDMETAQRMVIEAAKIAMPNTKVVDEEGNPRVVYHGSTAMFTVFDKSRIGSATGTADGRGFYFTTDRDYALGYKTPDGHLFEVFLNIEKPLSYDKKTITKAQLRKILKEADRVEYEQEGEHYMLSNYANYNDVGIDGAVNEGANLEYDYADNDVELVGSLIGGSGSFDLIMDAVKKVTGKSGMIAPKDNGTIHYVVTDPTGIKSAEPVTYDDNGNVIPLSERFNPENEDIRFRVRGENESAEEFVQSEIDRLVKDYNPVAPIRIADLSSREALVKSLGIEPERLSEEDYQVTLQIAKERIAAYSPELDIVAIFVPEAIANSKRADDVFFHENGHGIVKRNPRLVALGQWLFENSEKGVRKIIAKSVREDYAEANHHEEMLTNYAGKMMASGRSREVMDMLPDDMKPLWDEFLTKSNYNSDYEDRLRRELYSGRTAGNRAESEGVQMRNGNVDDRQRPKVTWTRDESDSDLRFRTTEITPEVRAEMDTIAATAIVNGNYLKAPNGADTNLTAEQWAMVRTKNFKAWFGLWEENFLFDNLLSRGGGIMGDTVVDSIANSKILDPVIASIPVNVMNNLGGKKRTAQMLLHNIPMFVDVMTLSSTDADIFTFAVSAMKVIALTRAKLSSTESTSSNGKLLSALDTLQDNLIFSLASLASTRKLTDASIVFPPTRNRAEHLIVSGLSAMFTDIHNLNNLGIKDSENIAKYQTTLKEIADAVDTNASKVVDENGEPKVVYHGSGRSFTIFDKQRSDENNELGAGFYFTDNPDVADLYTRSGFSDNEERYVKRAREIFNQKGAERGLTDKYESIEYFDFAEDHLEDYGFLDESVEADYEEAFEQAYEEMFSQKNVMPVFLNLRSPYMVEGVSPYNAKELARQKDVDGFIDNEFSSRHEFIRKHTENKNFSQYVAFEPSQIKSATDNTGEFSEENSDIRFKVVTDAAKIEDLEDGPKVEAYRAVQIDKNGKIFSPMASRLKSTKKGSKQTPNEAAQMNQWDEAVESLDKVDENGKITILDEDGGTTKVAYNPYGHCCVNSMMNDQFKRAWERDGLYVMKVLAPESELTAGYHAEKAKDAVGIHKWKTGAVGNKLPESKRREILLTRWMKNVRVMPWEAVAQDWIKTLEGENVDVPFNVVPRKILNMLAEAGVKIVAPEKGMENATKAYEQWLADPKGYVGDTELPDHVKALNEETDDDISFRITGTPTDEVVANGLDLSPAQTADLAGNIFAALPESARAEVTASLNGDILGLQDAIMQIPARLAMKENWDDEDKAVAEVIAEQMTKAVGMEMTRPFSASEALWTLYNATHKDNDIISEASRALVRSNLGFDSQTLGIIDEAKDGVRFRTVGDASANAEASLYNRGAANVWTRLKESYVDMNASVEKLVKSIEKASGKVAQGFENILMALNQQSSKGLAAMESYTEKFLNPMFDEIVKIMKKAGKSYQDVVRYVILKHGLERNVKLAQRDAKAHYQEIYDDIISKITGMNDAQKRTYLTNAQLKEADAKAELARLQAIDQFTLTDDQLRELKRDLAKARKAVTEAEENLKRAEKIRNMSEQEAQDELGKIFEQIESGKDSVYKDLRNNDYSGISSMFYDQLGVDRRKYSTEEEYQAALMLAKEDRFSTLADVEAEAKREVAAFEKAAETKTLWKRINAATKETLRQQYEANMISKEQYLNLRDMFEYYVPLRGFKDNTAEDMYTYYRKPNSTGYTKPILGAEGRKTEAESPFGWIASMAGSAIASNVKNEAKLALYYFVSNRPDNGIATVSKTWFVHTPGDVDANGKRIFRPAYPTFNEDLSSAEGKAQYEIWQANMKELQKQGLAYESGQRLNLGNAVVNIDSKNQPEHIVTVKVGGKDYTIVINGNPRAAQAINGDLNIESTASDYSAVFGPVLRWMSSVNTSYNPEFWITNTMRDMLFTMMSVNIKEDPAYRRAFRKNYWKAWQVVSLTAKNEKGTIGDSYMEKMYKDFVKYGGVTGYTQIKDSETWEKEIDRYLKSNNAEDVKAGVAMKRMKDGFHAMHRFGESLEQVSRFAAFVTAREQGKSMAEAVNDAKEITVNFNRKGSGKRISLKEAKTLTNDKGQPLKPWQQWAVVGLSSIAPLGRRTIMFFNAAIQGLNATYKLYAKNKTRAIGWALGYAAIGMIQALLHAMMDDDDDYLDMPQYERRNALMIGGNGVYFKWALPQEARAFYALGDLAVESVMGRNPHQNVIGEAIKIGTEVLPVNPTEGWRAFMPSVAIPAIEIKINEDYKGAPIYSDQKWLTEEERKRTAKWANAKKGTGKMYVELARLLNNVSGGDQYDAGAVNIQPEKVEHIVQSAFGGTIRTADKFFSTVMAAIDPEEEVTMRQFPFLNRFLTINDERYKNVHVNDVYGYYAAEAEHVKTLQKKYAKDMDKESLDRLRQSDEFRWMQIYSKYEKAIEGMQERIRAAEGTSERMELMKEQDEIKRRMIKEISELP